MKAPGKKQIVNGSLGVLGIALIVIVILQMTGTYDFFSIFRSREPGNTVLSAWEDHEKFGKQNARVFLENYGDEIYYNVDSDDEAKVSCGYGIDKNTFLHFGYENIYSASVGIADGEGYYVSVLPMDCVSVEVEGQAFPALTGEIDIDGKPVPFKYCKAVFKADAGQYTPNLRFIDDKGKTHLLAAENPLD